jgi:Ca2+-binding EF-hand superfamily protein
VFRSADTAKTGELTATELQALFAARQTELSDRQLAYLMVQVTHSSYHYVVVAIIGFS